MLAKSDQEEELEREGDNGENVLKEKERKIVLIDR